MFVLDTAFSIRAALSINFHRRVDTSELLDETDLDEHALRHNLRDIERVNRYFGGVWTVLSHLKPLLDGNTEERPATVLDLGTGAADIPLAISRWAETAGRKVEICASDRSDQILDIARERLAGEPAITFATLDARNVDLPDRSFDVVLCSLTLHHFGPEEAVAILREMDRLSTRGFIVNDLRRSRLAYVAAWLASRIATRSHFTRHDAPLSVRRAYTPPELRALIDRVGVKGVRIERASWFRMVAVQDKRHAGS